MILDFSLPFIVLVIQDLYSLGMASRTGPYKIPMSYLTYQPLYCTESTFPHHDHWRIAPPMNLQNISTMATAFLAPRTQQSEVQKFKNPDLSPFTTLLEASEIFIATFRSPHTRRTYGYGFKLFWSQEYLNPRMTLKEFSFQNLEDILDRIRNELHNFHGQVAAESSRQARAAEFVSFTDFLERRYGGIRRVTILKVGANKTFSHRRDETIATILTEGQRNAFFSKLKELNMMGHICALMQYHGMRRIGEVLRVKLRDVLWTLNVISFTPSKGGQVQKKDILIKFTPQFMQYLRGYVQTLSSTNGSDFLFPNSETPYEHLPNCTIYNIYRKTWKEIDPSFLPNSITHCIRATAIATAIVERVSYERIRMVTGHCDFKMIAYYGEKALKSNMTQEPMFQDILNTLAGVASR